jgi:predicted transcriptional regulator
MQSEILLFLGGVLLGGLIVRSLMVHSERRAIRSHEAEQHYVPAMRAIRRHLQTHGTVNVEQASYMLSLGQSVTALYLTHMQRDGLVKFQKHKGSGGFYTLA